MRASFKVLILNDIIVAVDAPMRAILSAFIISCYDAMNKFQIKESENSMKVNGPGGTQGTSKSKKSSKSTGDAGGFGDLVTGAAKETAANTATQSIAQVDALLAIQGADDATQGKAQRRMRQRADTILDELDKLRGEMLGGTLTVGHVIDIADVVASHREKITDPGLTAILDEIDLRAQVELAKMRAAMDG